MALVAAAPGVAVAIAAITSGGNPAVAAIQVAQWEAIVAAIYAGIVASGQVVITAQPTACAAGPGTCTGVAIIT